LEEPAILPRNAIFKRHEPFGISVRCPEKMASAGRSEEEEEIEEGPLD